ncbi:phosphoribosylaminoimidazolesuccinocarboxamide synthase [Enterococcus rivorum]|uniref:Phosphoribosylaminoimidazole-succinocarboxamide synthase n=1 Tax=Enterococcus rivorum TaxID=762845 RepID=A0A1E5KZL6_9ENTE|nr:phosphoribosylaminoimidazolesuccinocarboxamide synthase [Enterococcus rivorum]MBP2099316.1 phosphoribosylaminoimidazole-succinocarboxamide synthase [Enterococcus rivorum]OEH83301.1 phosphoribosylaminoimidazolesuccinocarboxamide synthase [Enterococcus rivorum]
MEKGKLLYEGKAKKIFETEDSSVLWIEYLDQATALNGARKDEIQGKGLLNNQISSFIFKQLKAMGVESHFIKKISKTEQLVNSLQIVPLEVVIRNVAAGSFSKRLDVKEGTLIDFPILEFYYKEDRLDDPFINEDHMKFLELATEDEIKEIKKVALIVNEALIELFKAIDITLVDFKIEFGRYIDGRILLGDEISPDTCRLWDSKTNQSLDKDIYRKNLGDMVSVYQEVLDRLEQLEK